MKKLRIAAAITVAIGSCLLSPRESWSRISGTTQLLWKILWRKTNRTDPAEASWRYSRCEKCPVFYKPLRTCGSPLDKELKGLGCLCSVELKKNIKEATCWGDDNLGDEFEFGWKSTANSGRV